MQSLDLDQYWPSPNRPLSTSGPVDGERLLHEPLQTTGVLPVGNRGRNDTAPQTLPENAARDRQTHLIWGGLGFVAGMVVWHMIGFWTFVLHVAFNDDQRAAAAIASTSEKPAQLPAQQKEYGPMPAGKALAQHDPQNCIALAIDRMSGSATPERCPANGKPLADAGRRQRDDLAFTRPRLQDPQLWAGVTAVESEVAIETIDESAFDLMIRPGP